MKSIYQYIVKPLGDRYNNKVLIDNKELIINTSISSHKFVNRIAEVVSTPKSFNTKIEKGDLVIVHHNLFRRYYNMKGKSVNSSKYFKNDLYFASIDQIYMYKKTGWLPFNNYCFVKPIIDKDDYSSSKLKKNIGVLKYGNNSLEVLGINPGDIIGFKPNREFEFIINKELLYCMESNDIVIKYEHQKNKTEYNPSWAKSS